MSTACTVCSDLTIWWCYRLPWVTCAQTIAMIWCCEKCLIVCVSCTMLWWVMIVRWCDLWWNKAPTSTSLGITPQTRVWRTAARLSYVLSRSTTWRLSRWGCYFLNTLRTRQNGRHFVDGTFKCIFLNENARFSIEISLMFVPKGPINNIPALVQIMAWHQPGDKPLSEPMVVSLPTHIYITRPQWVHGLMS